MKEVQESGADVALRPVFGSPVVEVPDEYGRFVPMPTGVTASVEGREVTLEWDVADESTGWLVRFSSHHTGEPGQYVEESGEYRPPPDAFITEWLDVERPRV